MQKISRVLPIVLFLNVSLLLTSCGGGGNSGILPEKNTVAPLYSINGANWNDYVNDDGSDTFSASDTACNPVTDGACIHGGQTMSMDVPDTTSCVDLSANDYVSVFEWVCDDSVNPVRFISTGFKSGKGLSDLVDFNSAVFKENYLEVQKTGGLVFGSKPEIWWKNDIVVNNDGSNGVSDMAVGEIHIITQNANASYTIGADRFALLVEPGVVLTGNATGTGAVVSATNRNFIWIEGAIDATGDPYAILFNSTNFSVINKTDAFNAQECVSLYHSSYNTLSNIMTSHVSNTNNYNGVKLYTSSYNNLEDISTSGHFDGVLLQFASDYNVLRNITASNNDFYGVSLSSSSDNILINIIASDNSNTGVSLVATSDNTLNDITASGNRSGVSLISSPDNSLNNITTNNNDNGVSLSSSDNNVLSDIASNNNINNGVFISASSDNTLSNITANNNNQGVRISSNSNNNTLSNMTVNYNIYYGVSVVTSSINNTLSNITASNNDYGVYLYSLSNNNTLSNITASNNDYGVYSHASSDNTLSNITASDNSYGIYLFNSSDSRFTGDLQVGINLMSDCYVIFGTNPGLVDGTCATRGAPMPS